MSQSKSPNIEFVLTELDDGRKQWRTVSSIERELEEAKIRQLRIRASTVSVASQPKPNKGSAKP